MDSLSCRARADQRRESRFAAEIDATLSWGGVSQPVIIRNISIYGALLTGAWLPAVGERATLIAEGLEVCGTVIWEGPDRCGLLLSSAIDPVATIGRSGARNDERPAITLRRVGPDRYA
ncbi:PilZ domain-containing protein [Sphingobium sp. HBC34]|uniref:PilZ domain-containing protein n=1 Tax=Sphingobium cyanobacteriorum TaxID=3063954 RepID=A0ABT8ZNQ6_9SPHN|nr:PilZ domain-containing protein [Sphingobium sp. HBC34]MDO7836101.1 PilZ domain-containing protein [Sphingobium sp. HBC34]